MCLECFKCFYRDKKSIQESIQHVDGEILQNQGSVWSDMSSYSKFPKFLSSWSLPKGNPNESSERQEFELKFDEYLALDEDPLKEDPQSESGDSHSSTLSQLLG